MAGDAGDAPLIRLSGLYRTYGMRDQALTVLKNVDLTIAAGELVAIVGPSGSGKSTLLNILGCLDKPTSGSYRLMGHDTSDLGPDDLAKLRRDHIGFIFQRYHLLPDLTALANVELPAIYGSRERGFRHARALALLGRLGLGERVLHRPGELSGGQQQRVAIARALINGGDLILADEPTGALDTRSGEEMLRLLRELHQDGHTVVIVTHDMEVARHAHRIIEIRDGEIVADNSTGPASVTRKVAEAPPKIDSATRAVLQRLATALYIALSAMISHRLRTLLTTLGVVIGIASVALMASLGEATQKQIETDLSSLGTRILQILPGSNPFDFNAPRPRTLVAADADALAQIPFVTGAAPEISASASFRADNVATRGIVNGVGEQYLSAHALKLEAGTGFDRDAVQSLSQVAILTEKVREALFADKTVDPIGKVVLLNDTPVRVIGVLQHQEQGFSFGSELTVYLPYTAVMRRLLGRDNVDSITVRVADDVPSEVAEAEVQRLLTLRHGSKDFYIQNFDDFWRRTLQVVGTIRAVFLMIGTISLLVGGIGVMNIMLVSVTERTKEIGIRVAIGARRSDIQQQFLIEAVLVCMVGCVLGVLLAVGVGTAISQLFNDFHLIFSLGTFVTAFACSTVVGVAFGYLPARRAARLDPVVALVRE